MKTYVKPELFYERYELSKHIADCAWELQSGDANSCRATFDTAWSGPSQTLFISTIGCDVKTDEGAYDAYCYFDGAEGFNVFRS